MEPSDVASPTLFKGFSGCCTHPFLLPVSLPPRHRIETQMAQQRTGDDSGDLKAALAKLAQVYSNCTTYEDHGFVRHTMPGEGDQERSTEDFFTTAFDRHAKRFRFEFRPGNPQSDLDNACIAWRNGDSAKLWTESSGRIETVERVGLAVAGALGTCGEPSFLIPNLLSPQDVAGRGLLGLDDLRITGHESFNNSDCLKISGLYPSRSKLTVWVETNTFLILRAEEETAMARHDGPRFHGIFLGSGPLLTTTTINYSPRINTAIPAAKFQLLVPEK